MVRIMLRKMLFGLALALLPAAVQAQAPEPPFEDLTQHSVLNVPARVAYPLANRFRTGMTLAMFSLIIFSLVVMSMLDREYQARRAMGLEEPLPWIA